MQESTTQETSQHNTLKSQMSATDRIQFLPSASCDLDFLQCPAILGAPDTSKLCCMAVLSDDWQQQVDHDKRCRSKTLSTGPVPKGTTWNALKLWHPFLEQDLYEEQYVRTGPTHA